MSCTSGIDYMWLLENKMRLGIAVSEEKHLHSCSFNCKFTASDANTSPAADLLRVKYSTLSLKVSRLCVTQSRRKWEINVWKNAHFSIKCYPLTIITFTVMIVPLCQNLYYLLNLFDCEYVTKVNRTRIGS